VTRPTGLFLTDALAVLMGRADIALVRTIPVILMAAAVLVPSAASAEPSGQLLAISLDGRELSIVSPSRDAAARIVERGHGLTVANAQWSPDGSQIAFTSPIPGGTRSELFVVDADGGRLRAVRRDSDVENASPNAPLWISPREIGTPSTPAAAPMSSAAAQAPT
jgi:hypothetical protein